MRRSAVLYLLVFLWGSSSFGYAADTIYSSFGPGDTYWVDFWASFGNTNNYAEQYASFTVPGAYDYRLTRIELALDYYSGTPTGTIYGGLFADNSGYPTGELLESFELNGVYGPRGTGSIISVNSMTNPILQADKKYWVGLWTPGANGYDWNGTLPEWVDSVGQDRVYANDAHSIWTFIPYDVAFRVTGDPVPASDIINTINKSVSDGSLVGTGADKSSQGRLGAFENMIENARDLTAIGDTAAACIQLADAYMKTDGLPRPPDLVAGDAAAELAQMIGDLIDDLGCFH